MRRTTALAALLLLPLAFLSFGGPGLKPERSNAVAGAEGASDLSSVVALQVQHFGTIRGWACLALHGDRQPLPGAEVSVVGTGLSTLADANGLFSFTLRPGGYKVRVHTPGYAPARAEVSVDSGAVVELEICVDTPVTPKTVQIGLDRIRRTATVSPDPLYIAPGDLVVWSCPDGYPWTVHFSPISPLSERRILSPSGEPQGGTVRADVAPGKYSYFIAVAVGDWVFTADPELIDENEERKGGTQPD